ncbi:hypothetical protein M011DRAFT_411587 [Sporormia fimetaria CBS 119925]|uniref:Uncharacterized protein n=1 Tax=Sporormia fimetaria CBS 119925 TaxID=1340428 RepID=A0A6A6UZT0_9PLEO|nr:hypothetical protein M011DRAFT_411587 [Sporormia fimetaria CBS 119925]
MTVGPARRLFSSATRSRVPARALCSSLSVRPVVRSKQSQTPAPASQLPPFSVARNWFTSTATCLGTEPDHKPPDERTLNLGRTIRILHDRLPTLLASPLPQDILSPHITLHLFPSTHPHLPSVSGKIAYTAALWTAPVAWGRVPVVGNVNLTILSERMVKNGAPSSTERRGHEKLIVRWRTCGDSDQNENRKDSEAMEKISKIVSRPDPSDKEFSGLFIFEFDEQGRILSHTIEHAEESGSWDRTAKVISVTDWLLGRAWGNRGGEPSLAFERVKQQQRDRDGR